MGWASDFGAVMKVNVYQNYVACGNKCRHVAVGKLVYLKI
jgi:hypothetical protein